MLSFEYPNEGYTCYAAGLERAGDALQAEVAALKQKYEGDPKARLEMIAHLENDDMDKVALIATLKEAKRLLASEGNRIIANLDRQVATLKVERDALAVKVSDAEMIALAASPLCWERICIWIDYPDTEAGIRYTVGTSKSDPWGWGDTLWVAFKAATQHPEALRAAREAAED